MATWSPFEKHESSLMCRTQGDFQVNSEDEGRLGMGKRILSLQTEELMIIMESKVVFGRQSVLLSL